MLPPETEMSMMLGNGAQGRNRTTDTVIFSHVLYQLSYLGIRGCGRGPIEHFQAGATPGGSENAADKRDWSLEQAVFGWTHLVAHPE
jgi:hypothetical protein